MNPKFTLVLLAIAFLHGCSPFTSWERTVIEKSDSLMYVTVYPEDSTILRTPSRDVPARALKSAELQALLDKMLYTVTDPSQDGVGIAAPQVGINRRIVCVRRLDKAGAPFESYVNIRLDSLYGSIVTGPEGCLSVPPLRGMVPRHSSVAISYANLETGNRIQETVDGYTAIIFQHECDHLDGILYTDRADTVFTDQAWAAERQSFTYNHPEWWKE
ncbi:MAG: peptide deformylase [Bacteroidales bacterium]|nr:peptide deformylase [Bacteroidales bacterium]